jgi:hypothetical protein
MRTYRNIALATAIGATLFTATYSSAAPDSSQTTPSSDQLNKEYQNLSPATRAALAEQLKSKGIDGLSNMSESDAKTAFAGLSPEVKAQIQAKWAALSDEQRTALKKMGPAALKELVASQVKEVMTQSVAQSAKTMMQKGREYVQGLIAKLKGHANQPEEPAQ